MKTKFFACLLAALTLTVPSGRAAGLVAHEWGTFTSVQGSDGELIAWNPITNSELPGFVYERNRALNPVAPNRALSFSKSMNLWLQRMETPVIYFYTDTPARVTATVDFPDGLVTEWFPRATEFGPRVDKRSFIRWTGLEVRPGADETRLPSDQAGHHYFAARETDSAVVTVTSNGAQSLTAESEKFLFYRGVGNFKTPLHARFEQGKLVLLNRGGEEMPHLFLLEVRGMQARTAPLPARGGGGDAAVEFAGGVASWRSLAEVRAELAATLERALVDAGLYPREAAAMLKTWNESWFTEPGTRVLYLLPRAWTDRVLPLKLEPSPRELVRVMVGRAEIFTPEVEGILGALRASQPRPDQRPALLQRLRADGFGRFAEPALARSELIEPEVRTPVLSISSGRGSSTDCAGGSPLLINGTLKVPSTYILNPPLRATWHERNATSPIHPGLSLGVPPQ